MVIGKYLVICITWQDVQRNKIQFIIFCSPFIFYRITVEPGYNDIGLYGTSSIASDILWYQLIPHY
jgi:hypothetical protein